MTFFFLLRPSKASLSGIDTHDGLGGGGYKRRRKRKEDELKKIGVGELRFIQGSDFKFKIRDTLKKELQLSDDEEDFIIMLLMSDDHDN